VKHKAYTLPGLATKVPASARANWPPRWSRRLYYDVWLYLQSDWDATCRAYEARPGDFYNAWRYLNDHPIYWRLRDGSRTPHRALVAEHAGELRDRISRAHIIDALKEDLTRLTGQLEAVACGPPRQVPREHVRNLDHGYGFSSGAIEIDPHLVNPDDGRVSEDPRLNTRLEFWYETGEWTWSDPESHVHAYRLDGGAPTYEQAVIDLARKVHRYYGNDRARCQP
jgi:hypothetical protein